MATPSPAARSLLLPPNPALVRLLRQRGPLGRGVHAKLLRCSALWGIPFGPTRPADAIRTPSFVTLRATAEPVRWRLPPGLAAAFAEPEPDAAASGTATAMREEPHAQRTGAAEAGSRAGRNAGFPAEPHVQRYSAAREEPHAQRADTAGPHGQAGGNPGFAAEPHVQRYAALREELHAQRADTAGPHGQAGGNPGFAAEPHAQRYARPREELHAQRTQAIAAAPAAGQHAEIAAEPHAQRYAPSAADPNAEREVPRGRPVRDFGGKAVDAGAKPRHDVEAASAVASPQATEPARPTAGGDLARPVCVRPCASVVPDAFPARQPQAGRKFAAKPHAQRCEPGAAPQPRQTPTPTTNRGWLKNGATPGDFLAAPRCGARTRAGHPCRQPAMANGRCRLHGGFSTGPRTAAGVERIRSARTIHGAYAAPERARTQPLRSFIRRSQIFLDLHRLEPALPEPARARLPALPPELPIPPAPGHRPPLPTRRQEREAAAAEAARLAPWRLAIQAAQAQRRDGAVPPELLAAVDQAFAALPPGAPLGGGTG